MAKHGATVLLCLLLAGCSILMPRTVAEQKLGEACRSKINNTPLLPVLLSTPQKVDSYCSCASNKLVSSLSDDEMQEIASKGKAVLGDPKWQGRLLNVGVKCLNTLVE
ncbi:hypothetical protein [Vogesella sp. LIG4]|uniref:hypothetical protein n=1 Tax=Vogesella sp. LIG4 TaxID=1192162 RepID=UPI00081FEA7E|nr:hypothetical protein [Vogesella sp. LIG4]SCK07173.1 hypothetical protein PSELUDRAFT_0343 [Vogesella sp. LIG4]